MLYVTTWILMLLISGVAQCSGRDQPSEMPCVVLVECLDTTSPFAESGQPVAMAAEPVYSPLDVRSELRGSPFAASFENQPVQQNARLGLRQRLDSAPPPLVTPPLVTPPLTMPLGNQLALTGRLP